jgi:hypothetical protein
VVASRPARITFVAVEPSAQASGSHVWNGNIGSFTAKAMKKPSMIHMAACGLSGVPKRSVYSKV